MNRSIVFLVVVIFVFCLILVAGLRPYRSGPSDEAIDGMEMRILAIAVLDSAEREDGVLPGADGWRVIVQEYEESNFPLSETMRKSGHSFALNVHVAGVSLQHIDLQSETVLLFECGDAKVVGGAAEVPAQSAFAEGHLVAFVDGHLEHVDRQELQQLIWLP